MLKRPSKQNALRKTVEEGRKRTLKSLLQVFLRLLFIHGPRILPQMSRQYPFHGSTPSLHNLGLKDADKLLMLILKYEKTKLNK